MSGSSRYELIFWDVESSSMISASAVNDVPWHDWSCILGWPVQGIFAPFWDGTDVNSVALNEELSVLARADDFGKVRHRSYADLTPI